MKELTQLQNNVIALRRLEDKKKELDTKYAAKKKALAETILKQMKQDEVKTLCFVDKSGLAQVTYTCSLVEPQSIKYDVSKLEKTLSKKQLNKVVEKRIVVNDTEAFIEYLKSIGANPKEFKNLITVNKEVDKKALEQMYELREVTFKQLEGTYKITNTTPYLKTTSKQ